jgi:Sugar (and other) transporter
VWSAVSVTSLQVTSCHLTELDYLALILASVGITSVTHQTLISGCLQIWNFFWAVAAAASVDKLGRRALFLASGSIMLVSYIIITGLSGAFAQTGHAATGVAVIPFLFVFFGGYDIALYVQSPIAHFLLEGPLTFPAALHYWCHTLARSGLTTFEHEAWPSLSCQHF